MNDWQQMLSADVLTLGMAADEARRAQPSGNRVTYLRVHVTSVDELRAGAAIPEAASEVRLHALPSSLEEAVQQVRRLRQIAGGRRIAAFSMSELEARGWATAGALAQLVAAGMDDVAELPADGVVDLGTAVRALRTAGADPQRITISHPVGDRRIAIVNQVKQAFADSRPVRRFAPLPRVAPADKPTTGYDDVRMVALARLALGQASIEVDWSLYGPKLAQVALTFGADHVDAVASTDDAALGRRRATVEDLERNIEAAGFEPAEYRATRVG